MLTLGVAVACKGGGLRVERGGFDASGGLIGCDSHRKIAPPRFLGTFVQYSAIQSFEMVELS